MHPEIVERAEVALFDGLALFRHQFVTIEHGGFVALEFFAQLRIPLHVLNQIMSGEVWIELFPSHGFPHCFVSRSQITPPTPQRKLGQPVYPNDRPGRSPMAAITGNQESSSAVPPIPASSNRSTVISFRSFLWSP